RPRRIPRERFPGTPANRRGREASPAAPELRDALLEKATPVVVVDLALDQIPGRRRDEVRRGPAQILPGKRETPLDVCLRVPPDPLGFLIRARDERVLLGFSFGLTPRADLGDLRLDTRHAFADLRLEPPRLVPALPRLAEPLLNIELAPP